MSLGDVINFRDGSYDIRAIIDDRYVVRVQNRKTGVQTYKVWTHEEREEFDRNQRRKMDMEDRACEIYERNLSGETYVSLGREYGISPGRVRQICATRARKEKFVKR